MRELRVCVELRATTAQVHLLRFSEAYYFSRQIYLSIWISHSQISKKEVENKKRERERESL